MKSVRRLALLLILVFAGCCVFASKLSPAYYSTQFREAPDAPPSHQFWLGTDELGRDRFSRLLYGGRISLLWAPAAAILSMFLAGTIGTAAGYLGGLSERAILAAIDVFLSLPWLFLLITARAALPLNVSPVLSVAITFGLLGLLGWAASARVVCSGVRMLKNSDFITMAKASGCSPSRIIVVQLMPNIRGILWAQFLVSIPVFILAEANLTILGLGVAEPLPSWGGLLRELDPHRASLHQPWRLAPLLVLMVTVWLFQISVSEDELVA